MIQSDAPNIMLPILQVIGSLQACKNPSIPNSTLYKAIAARQRVYVLPNPEIIRSKATQA